jgi:acetamidase/formamidase
MAEHQLDPSKIHFKWNNQQPPALHIQPGDVVHCWAQEVSNQAITRTSTAADLAADTFNFYYPLAGPIYVEGAEPGDALEVEPLVLKPDDWGWNGIPPRIGLLTEDFPGPYLRHWDLSNGRTTEFKPGIVIPLEPFIGTMGVAPAEPGEFRVTPPGNFGGNMDIRHLLVGSRLLLPVMVKGGLFSAGDCHAVQGDGEICVAIETPMWFSLRFRLIKNARLPAPQFYTRKRGPLSDHDTDAGYFVTTGVGPDLMEDTKNAVRAMVDWLVKTHKLSPEDAYLLCCTVVDLRMSEVVNRPNWIVSAYMPLSIFK